MDQVKLVLDFLKKHYFWFVCGILAVLVTVFSIRTAQQLTQQRNNDIAKIKAAVTEVQNVLNSRADVPDESVKAHPNDSTVKGMKAEIVKAEKIAEEAWVKRRQSQEPLYKWPDVLGDQRKKFEELPPPEAIPLPAFVTQGEKGAKKSSDKSDPALEMDAQVLEKYGREIHKVLPKLAAIIGADWKAGEEAQDTSQPPDKLQGGRNMELGASGGISGRGNAQQSSAPQGVVVKNDVVNWDRRDQARWNDMATNFHSEAKENRPNMVQCAYIQEDLWLLEALFRMIKEVNGEADSNDNAAIKQIDHIYFGQDAQGLSGELTPVDTRFAVQALEYKRRNLKGPDKPNLDTPAPPTTTKQRMMFDPADRRFVDSDYNPIAADTVRAAVQAKALSDNAALTVAKRIPFRIAFKMDERRIPAFLAACGNSAFRFETRQVRINRQTTGQPSGAKDSANDGSYMMDNPSDMMSFGVSGQNAVSGGDAEALLPSTAIRTTHDVTVEFYGFIKIYNPVNYNLFESDAKPGDTSADSATDTATF